MAKKRKTRQEKLILQLKRELAKKQAPAASPQACQEATVQPQPKETAKKVSPKKANESAYYLENRLIKADLLKSLALTALIFSLELVLYFRLR